MKKAELPPNVTFDLLDEMVNNLDKMVSGVDDLLNIDTETESLPDAENIPERPGSIARIGVPIFTQVAPNNIPITTSPLNNGKIPIRRKLVLVNMRDYNRQPPVSISPTPTATRAKYLLFELHPAKFPLFLALFGEKSHY